MFALKSGQDGRAGAVVRSVSGWASASEGFVLPRWLRRPVRMFARLGEGDLTPPRFAASMATALLLSASGLYGAYLGGHMPAFVQGVTARTGFAVDQVRIFGHRETSEIDILERLELDGWTSLVGMDAGAARARIAELPWVESAAVRKIYPDELEVRIVERKPFAIWQHGSELSLVETDGRVIAPFTSSRHAALPLVIGYGAPQQAEAFIAKVKGFPEIAGRVKGYIRVAERRWDLRMENGVTVKLPESGEDAALAALAKLDAQDGILSRDIAAVDMRLNDRLVIQLTPEAAETRQASLDGKAKAAKAKSGKKI